METEDEKKYPVPLTDGSQEDLRNVQCVMGSLKHLRRKYRVLFDALWALAQDPAATISQESRGLLIGGRFLDDDGSVRPIERKLLLLTGPDLEKSPYRDQGIADRLTVAMAEVAEEEGFLNELLKGEDEEPQKPSGRERG